MKCAQKRAVVGVGREDGGPVEDLVDVLDDDERLADGPVAVEEHGDLLVDGVVLEQEVALAAHVLQDELVVNSLETQGHLGAVHERASECADQLHRFRRRRHLRLAPRRSGIVVACRESRASVVADMHANAGQKRMIHLFCLSCPE